MIPSLIYTLIFKGLLSVKVQPQVLTPQLLGSIVLTPLPESIAMMVLEPSLSDPSNFSTLFFFLSEVIC